MYNIALNAFQRHVPLKQIIEFGFWHGFCPEQTILEASNAGYARCVVEPILLPTWRRLFAEYTEAAETEEGNPIESIGDFDLPTETCGVHNIPLGEGGYCAECEAQAEPYVVELNKKMSTDAYSLWVKSSLCEHVFKVPVYNFHDAKRIHLSLGTCITSSRIARYSEEEGGEVYIHKFI